MPSLRQRADTVYPQDQHPDASELGGAFVGRAKFLGDQLGSQGVCVAALQETRSRSSETYVSRSHIRLTSAKSDDGSYGVELWFAREHAFMPLYFQPDDCLAVHWNPRILAVRFTRSSLRVLFVCVHAPHSRDGWWDDLFQLSRRITQDAYLVLLGDYNLHLHFSHAQGIGDLVWGTPNPDPPAAFYRLIDHFSLRLPSTFDSWQLGDTTTWCPSVPGPLA